MNKLFTKAFGTPMASICLGLLLLGLFTFTPFINQNQPVAQAATSSNLNFQSRLLTSAGNTVPDGNYHIEFKLYNANNTTGSSQGSCSGDANCLWTETRTTGNLVRVVNGYLTVNLGSVTAFPSTIDWDQEHWLGMRVGGSDGSPAWETIELTTDGTATGGKLKLTAVPYAFKAGQLAKRTGANTSTLDFDTQTGAHAILLPDAGGTVCLNNAVACGFAATTGGAGYIQNQSAVQQTTSSYWISGNGRADTALQAPLLDTATAVALNIGTTNATAINLNQNTTIAAGKTFTVTSALTSLTGATSGDALNVSNSTSTGNIAVFKDNATAVATIADGGAITFRNASDSTTAFVVQSAISGTDILNIDSSNSQLSVRGINSVATLGSELAGGVACSGTNWTGTGPWTHTAGSTAPLSCSPPASVTAGATYQIQFDVDNNTAPSQSVMPNLGGKNGLAIVGENYEYQEQIITTVNTNALIFTPTTNFDGAVDFYSLKQVVLANNVLTVKNSNNTVGLEVRSGGSGLNNTFIGLNSGMANMTGTYNTGTGSHALQSNTTGTENTGTGSYSLQSNTVGVENTAHGTSSLYSNTTGINNTATGAYSLVVNTTGSRNTATGSYSLDSNTTGSYNTASGDASLASNTTGSYNASYGYWSLDSNTTGSYNTAIGYRAGTNDGGFSTGSGLQEATAIGAYSQVQQSNSLILGRSATGSTQTKIGIGTTAPTNLFSISPIYYNAGTASTTASSTVVGVSTTWTSDMVGMEFIFANGSKYTITGFTDTTHLTLSASSTNTSQDYRIHNPAFYVSDTGSAALRSSTNSTTAFQVQNAAGSTLLSADTTNMRINVGTNGTATGQLYVSGSVPTAAVGTVATGTFPISIYVQGRYAYVVNYTSNTLGIYDVSNPASPVSVGSVATGTTPQSVYVQGRYAYVANFGSSTLTIYDVSNPASPVSAGSVATGSGPASVYVQGRYAYVANNTSSTLGIYDVSNPASPVSAGSVASGSNPRSVYVQGRYAYVANYGAGTLGIYDVSNPVSPTSVGSVAAGINPISIYVQDRYAYVAIYGSDTLGIYDVSNPASPTSVGSVATGFHPTSVYVQGRYVYTISDGNSTLGIYDVSNPASPTSVGSLATGTTPYSVFVQGRYAYVTKYTSNTLVTYDLGGAYVQQLEAGGIETGTLSVRSNVSIGGNTSIQGGLTVLDSTQLSGGLGVNGNSSFKSNTNSTTAFQIQNAAGSSLLNVDTSNNQITLGGNNSGEVSTWTTNANALALTRQKHSSVVANGYIYVVGGSASQRIQYAKVNADGTVGAWTNSATYDMPAARQEAVVVAANGYLYVAGGYDGGAAVKTVYYAKLNSDGSLGAWKRDSPDIPAVRSDAAGFVANGYLYVTGGADNTPTVQSTVYYAKLNANGTTGAWSTNSGGIGGASATRALHTAVAANGYVYIIGGIDGSTTAQTTVGYGKLNLDGTISGWGSGTVLPAARDRHTTVVANGRIYVIGGEVTYGGTKQSTVYYASLTSGGGNGSWTAATNSLAASSGAIMDHSSVVVNGNIYVIGGNNGSVVGTVYYASTQRIKMGGALDLVGYSGGNLSEGETGTGGELTAGNTNIVGRLDVRGNTSLGNGLNVMGDVSIKATGSSTSVFNIQSASGESMVNVSADYGELILNHASLYLAGVPVPVSPTLSSQGTGGTLAADTYYYRVSSYNSMGIASIAIATTPASVTTTGSTSRNTISWTQVEGIVGYLVDRSDDNGVTWYRNDVGNVASIIDNGSTYTWSGSNVDANGRINYSASATLESGGALFLDTSGDVSLNKNHATSDIELTNLSTGGGIILTGNDLQYTDSSSFENLFTVSSIGEALFKTETGNDSTTAFQVQNAAGITLLGIDTTNSRIFSGVADGASAIGFTFNTTNNYSTSGAKLLSVQNATSEKFSIDKDGHIVTYGHIKSTQTTAPTIGTPTSCGTSPTSAVTANSTDSAGSVTINTGSGSPTTCNTIVTFNRGYGTAPKAVIVSGKNANTELSDVYVSATSTTTFTISAPAASVSPSDTWEIYYWVVE